MPDGRVLYTKLEVRGEWWDIWSDGTMSRADFQGPSEVIQGVVVDGLYVPEYALYGYRNFRWGELPGRRVERPQARTDPGD